MTPRLPALAGLATALVALAAPTPAQGSVKSFQKISNFYGGLYRPRLRDSDQLGRGVANIGDLNGDGVTDIAGGAHGCDDGADGAGSIWILFLNPDGSVLDSQKISATSGGFGGTLDEKDGFGRAVSGIGDWDGDGVPDLVVGANGDDDGGLDQGSIWLLFMNPDGTVKDQKKISALEGGFTGNLDPGDEFGRGMTLLADRDGDGVDEIVVCATSDDDGGTNRGALWVLFMNADGTVKRHQKISFLEGGLTAPLQDYDSFGMAVDNLGDFDGDGFEDLLVGSIGDDANGNQTGAIYLVLLNPDATVKSQLKINGKLAGMQGLLDSVDQFGFSVATLGDIDRDGVTDVAVGAILDDDGGFDKATNHGCAWILMLNPDGTVKTYQKISQTQGDFTGEPLDIGDWFGSSMADLGDLDGDGIPDLVVGCRFDDDAGNARGALYVFLLADTPPEPPVASFRLEGFEEGEPWTGPAPFTAELHDTSTGDIGRWYWNFGDGGMRSTFQTNFKTYDLPGTYTVRLTVTGPVGSDFVERQIVVTPPEAQFLAVPTRGVAPLSVPFFNRSSSYLTSFVWDFGDGRLSAQENPINVYREPGTYTVGLSATGDGWADEEIKVDYIQVFTQVPPTAAFTAAPLEGVAPLEVTFTDQSTGVIDGWAWDFGDGTTSTEEHPVKTYDTPGTYTVSLVVSNTETSHEKVEEAFVVVTAPAVAVAAFSGAPTSGPAPLQVAFTNGSSGPVDTYEWDFGDGTTSTETDPVHVYAAPGLYTVALTASGPDSSAQETKVGYVEVTALQAPVADFAGSPLSGEAPLQVSFTDLSTGDVTGWGWDFGDGTTSSEPSPLKTYVAAGTYTVSLTASNADQSDLLTRAAYVVVSAPAAPVAAFSAAPTTGPAPLDVAFTNLTAGAADAYLWDFGDGSGSSETSPAHAYATPGTYTVSLSASGPGGEDQEVKTDLIVVTEPAPVAAFSAAPTAGVAPLDVAFTNETTGAADAYLWDFGDGTGSSEADPLHAYATPGTYSVSLSASGPGGEDTLLQADLIVVSSAAPVAAFSATPTSGQAPLEVGFTNESTGDVDTYLWDFGDGEGSSEADPLHVYATPGTYSVSLSASGPGGEDTLLQASLIVVTGVPPVAAFSATPTSGMAPLEVAFTDESTGEIDAWLWDFGDGSGSSEASPVHVYSTAGTYSVSLSVSGPGGEDTLLQPGLVQVAEPPPVAAFTANPTTGEAPVEVRFQDQSAGNIASWLWEFGDGAISTQASPRHVYEQGGSYTVSLTVTSEGGTDTATFVGLIQLADPVPPGIFDGGFELQTRGALPSAPWQVSLGDAHRILSADSGPTFEGTWSGGGLGFGGPLVNEPDPDGRDGAMPFQGRQWCELSAEGTFDARRPSKPFGISAPGQGAGIFQTFRYEDGRSRLSCRVAFLLNGTPGAGASDWMSVELSDGSRTKVVWFADASSAFPETSDRTGLPSTGVVHLEGDVATLFPSATPGTDLRITFQVGNGGDGQAPSLGYVDHVELLPTTASAVACDGNPPGSLLLLGGGSRVGGTLVFGIDNPLGSQAPGALPLLAVSTARVTGDVCGFPVPGWSMYGDRPGDLLIAPSGIVARLVGSPWAGPGEPSPFWIDVPNEETLIGLSFTFQGLLYDPVSIVRFGLTEGVSLVLEAPAN